MRTLLLILAMTLPAKAGREFVSSSSEFAAKATPATTYPITISCWFRPANVTTFYPLVGLGLETTTAGDNRRLLLYAAGNVAGDPLRASAIPNSSTIEVVASTTSSFSANVWQHGCAVFDSATSRRVYLNAAGGGTNTTSTTTTGLNVMGVGARVVFGPSWGAFFDGQIAEVAVWNVALSMDEITSLAAGASPILIRPASRVSLIPMVGQEAGSEVDLHGAQLGLTNTPAPSLLHPRIYRP